jgi:tetratricopeptide (TPR) repeat protein
MAFWRKRGTGGQDEASAALAKADALYQRAIQMSHRPRGAARAERVSAEAVAAYRKLQRPDGDPLAGQARRKLALALWRQAMLLAANRRPEAALELGREGIALGRALLDATDPDAPELDDLIGETVTAMNDLSQAAMAAGHQDEHDVLVREAIALCGAHQGPRARQALGTALHNQAIAVANAAVADLAGDRPDDAKLTSALDAFDRVVDLRREIANATNPMSQWELANSLLHRGKLKCLAARGKSGATDLLVAWKTLAAIAGPSADTLRGDLRQAMRMAEEMFPEVVATLDWPWPVVSKRRPDQSHATSVHAGDVEAMVVAGCKAAEAGRITEARRLLGDAAKSGHPNALFNYGMLFAQYLQRPEEAMTLWERAARQDHALAALNLGNLSYQMGRRTDAERWFRRGAELGNAQAMFNLAMVLSVTGRAQEAAHWHQRGLAAERG